MAASLAPLDWHEEAAIYDNLIRTNGVVPLTRRSDVAKILAIAAVLEGAFYYLAHHGL
jgi:hypothetical protein